MVDILKSWFLPLLLCGSTLVAYGQGLSVVKQPEGFLITEQDRPVLFYRTAPDTGAYKRAGYIHPLFGYDGKALTESSPSDHPYQHGVYWAWHQILLEGVQVANGWICEDISWDVRKVKVRKIKDTLSLSSQVDWLVLLKGKRGKTRIVKEYTEITVYPQEKGYRMVDLRLQIKPTMEGVGVGGADNEKGYGGLSLRLKDADQLRFFSEKGYVEPKETPVVTGDWMDFRKLINGSDEGGVAVMVDPKGPDHKGEWILRSFKSMQNPVFPGRKPFLIPNSGLVLSYRFLVYGEGFDRSLIPFIFESYSF
ncbi:DUF6807 family protein [Sphingobacterium pedocola]|uniref:Methane oxygenase PmoA n=1 Tax=Sphingobacterium pedocola TaxID=2082722 RepID=A0ABR9TD26_9SPHI|nr:DUF6807 family protein [Sphingobacterium pedocola]MBE8723258.1 hypothetical protein [Sphingobacterium pedocola]